MRILAIDPGCDFSAYVVWDTDAHQVTSKGKIPNDELKYLLSRDLSMRADSLVIEMVASYGMAVGKEVFETCVWIGLFTETAQSAGLPVERVLRQKIKLHHCHSVRANDSNIRTALIDKYGSPGTKKSPNPVYNDHSDKMAKDIWAAFALATYVTEASRPEYFKFEHN